MSKDFIQTAIGVCTLIAITLGGMAYFAKADDLRLVELRLEQKVVGDAVYQLQARMWQLEDRNGNTPCAQWPQREREEYREIKARLDSLKVRQENLMRKK